jgi:DNA-binding response OmpR family regulator
VAIQGVPQPPAGEGPRVLVIDDDPTILELIRAILSEEGYVVDAALTGKAALADGNAPTPAVVVLDMYLPGISGAELVEALRVRYGHNLPIMLTSASTVDDEAQALGAYEYLPKPFDLEELLASVRRGLTIGDGAS